MIIGTDYLMYYWILSDLRIYIGLLYDDTEIDEGWFIEKKNFDNSYNSHLLVIKRRPKDSC